MVYAAVIGILFISSMEYTDESQRSMSVIYGLPKIFDMASDMDIFIIWMIPFAYLQVTIGRLIHNEVLDGYRFKVVRYGNYQKWWSNLCIRTVNTSIILSITGVITTALFYPITKYSVYEYIVASIIYILGIMSFSILQMIIIAVTKQATYTIIAIFFLIITGAFADLMIDGLADIFFLRSCFQDSNTVVRKLY